jgi:hypothetical protein
LTCARCTVERLMAELGLAGAVRGNAKKTTIADPTAALVGMPTGGCNGPIQQEPGPGVGTALHDKQGAPVHVKRRWRYPHKPWVESSAIADSSTSWPRFGVIRDRRDRLHRRHSMDPPTGLVISQITPYRAALTGSGFERFRRTTNSA